MIQCRCAAVPGIVETKRSIYREIMEPDNEYTVEEIEAANLHPDDGRVPHVPFGFMNAEWLEFKQRMLPGDKIYDFCSSFDSWQHLAGRMGYVLVRDGKVIAALTTRMS